MTLNVYAFGDAVKTDKSIKSGRCSKQNRKVEDLPRYRKTWKV